jgi:[ribosomal protein S5]-alanine N-acetyltransferase
MKALLPKQTASRRLVLREPSEADAHDIFIAYAQDALVCRYMVWRPHTSESTVREFVASCIAAWDSGVRLPYIITEAGSCSAIGMIEARTSGFTVDLGYVLARSHWGKGYMPEAIAAVAGEALKLGYFRVQAFCDVENLPSQRALEKAQFTREGRLERFMVHPNVSPEPRPCYMYSKCR